MTQEGEAGDSKFKAILGYRKVEGQLEKLSVKYRNNKKYKLQVASKNQSVYQKSLHLQYTNVREIRRYVN